MNSFNLYPHLISFKHKNYSFFYSCYGLILSVITYGIMIYMVNYFSYDFYRKTNPKVTFSQSQINQKYEVSLGKLFKSSSLSLEIEFNILNHNDTEIQNLFDEKFRFSIVKYTKLGSLIEMYYVEKGISTFQKLNTTDFNYSIGIVLEIKENTTLKFSSFKEFTEIPQNITKQLDDIILDLKDEIIQIIFDFKIPIEIINYTITKSDKFFEMKEFTFDTENYFSNSNHSIRHFFYQKGFTSFFGFKMVELKTDDNPFLKQINQDPISIPQVDFFYLIFSDKKYPDNYETLMHLEFRNLIDRYSRTFKKIIDIISELGGIFNPILMVGKLLVFEFNDKKYKLNLLNHLFTDEDIQTDLKINQNNIKKELNLSKKSHLFYKDPLNFDRKNNFKTNITQVFHDKSQNFHEIEMNDLSNESRMNVVKKTYKTNRIFERENFKIFDNKIKNLIEDKNLSIFINNKENSNIYQIDPSSTLDKYENKNNMIKKVKQKEINYQNNLLKDEDIKKKINSYLSLIKNRKNTLLIYSFKDVFQSILCQRKSNKNLREKEDIYKKLVLKLDFYFEITNLMKFDENFEKIKFILLNKNQINSFNYMINDINFNVKENDEKTLYELVEYFNKSNNNNYFEKKINEGIKTIMKKEIINLIKK